MFAETKCFLNKFNIEVSSLLMSSLRAIVMYQKCFGIHVISSRIHLFAPLLNMRRCTLWHWYTSISQTLEPHISLKHMRIVIMFRVLLFANQWQYISLFYIALKTKYSYSKIMFQQTTYNKCKLEYSAVVCLWCKQDIRCLWE